MVTVWPTPNGLPIASTTSPTRTDPGVPNATVGRFSRSTFSTARSVSGSVPTTFAFSRVLPSARRTSISSIPSTTWLLVSR